MATVYLAEDLKHHRKVAVKVLRQELAAILGAERFLQEIEVTAGLQHPNILALYDSGEADAFLYYVMPYIEGETLAARLKREKQLPVEEATKIAESVAAALQYAHDRGVIHRDIKPANILFQSGQAMVADFGIALAVTHAGGERLTETGLSLGTPHYMSPEQATGDRAVEPRSDIYALAAVTYEMLAGDPPHVGSTVQAVVAKLLAEPVAPLRSARPSTPRNVEAAVHRALAKIPADRFATASEFIAALRNPAFGAAEAKGAADPAALRRWKLAGVGAAAVALVMAGVALRGWTRPRPERPVVRYHLGIPDDQEVSAGPPMLGGRLALSPDGRRFAYVGTMGSAGAYQLWMRERDELSARPIPGTENGRRPFFSPDGSRLGYFTASQTLRVVSLTGEPPRTLNDSDLSATIAVWGEDDYIYGAARGQGAGASRGLVRIPEGGGAGETLTTADTTQGERVHEFPSLLPGGRGVVFSIVTGNPGLAGRRIGVLDLRSRRHKHLVQGVAGWYLPSGHLLYVTADGTLYAAAFDLGRLEITGPARALLAGVGVHALGVDVALSPDGTLMYITGSAEFVVRPEWVDVDGRSEPIDPAWSFPSTALYTTTALSPDGTRLVVSQEDPSGQHLWVKELPHGPNTRLTFQGTLNSRATWHGDGRTVVFVSDRDGPNQVWLQVADGSAPATRVSEHPANEGFFSPDGAWFFYRGIAGDRHIYARRTEGDTSVLAVARSARGEDVAANLSPDGRWVAYVSDESGRDEVYVRPFPEVNRMKRQISTEGGVEPRWARDGRTLYYRNEADRLVAVPLEADQEALRVGVARPLFSMSDYIPANRYQPTYEVAPGGRFILSRRVGAQGGAGGVQIIVVENFRADGP